MTLLKYLVLTTELLPDSVTLADPGFNQKVKVLVVDQRLDRVALAEEPRVVAQFQCGPAVVNGLGVFGHSLAQLVWELLLPQKQVEVLLAEGQSKSGQLQIVLELKDLLTGHPFGGVALETLVD